MTGQNIKTNYKTPEQEKKDTVIIKKHQERVALNREIREEARDQSLIGKAKRAVKSVRENPTTKKVGKFVQDRSEAIAHETKDLRPRRPAPSPMSTFGMGMPAGNMDMFGVGNFGGGGGLRGMMGADPFREMSPRRPPAPAPQRKKKRKTQHREPARSRGPDMFGIPDSMKWMF